VYLVILLAAGAILGGVVVVAMGRGGEMVLFDRDLPVKEARLETPGDVATLELPLGLIGYRARETGEALVAIANLLARRDAEIAAMRREIWRLSGDYQAVGPDVPAPGFAELGSAEPDVGAPSYASADDVAQEGSAVSEPGQDEAEREDEASRP